MAGTDNQTVVVGTVYAGVEKFLDDYFESLVEQSFRKFDILLANDGLQDFANGFRVNEIVCHSFEVGKSVSSNRRKLIQRAMEMGYEKIVFTDCDDVFETSRLEIVDELLDEEDIVVNDLDLIDGAGDEYERRYFASRLANGAEVDEKTIQTGNLMGLSNTAARSEVFTNSPALAGGDSIAFDWYLWACVFLAGYRAHFTTETATRYRIYENNTAGMPQRLDESSVCKGVEVKLQHYNLMRRVTPEYSGFYREFEEASNRLSSDDWRSEYVARLNEHAIDHHMWWENIRTPTEVGLG